MKLTHALTSTYNALDLQESVGSAVRVEEVGRMAPVKVGQ
jgi:hypothetical protein